MREGRLHMRYTLTALMLVGVLASPASAFAQAAKQASQRTPQAVGSQDEHACDVIRSRAP